MTQIQDPAVDAKKFYESQLHSFCAGVLVNYMQRWQVVYSWYAGGSRALMAVPPAKGSADYHDVFDFQAEAEMLQDGLERHFPGQGVRVTDFVGAERDTGPFAQLYIDTPDPEILNEALECLTAGDLKPVFQNCMREIDFKARPDWLILQNQTDCQTEHALAPLLEIAELRYTGASMQEMLDDPDFTPEDRELLLKYLPSLSPEREVPPAVLSQALARNETPSVSGPSCAPD